MNEDGTNSHGSVATIRELHQAMQEQDDRHEKALLSFRSEITTRLDVVLGNQQTAALIAAERTGRDDARLASLEMAVRKMGDESAVIATSTSRIDGLERRSDENDRRAFIRGAISGAITSVLGTTGILGLLEAAGKLRGS